VTRIGNTIIETTRPLRRVTCPSDLTVTRRIPVETMHQLTGVCRPDQPRAVHWALVLAGVLLLAALPGLVDWVCR